MKIISGLFCLMVQVLFSTPVLADSCVDGPKGKFFENEYLTGHYLISSLGEKVVILKNNLWSPNTTNEIEFQTSNVYFLDYHFGRKIRIYEGEGRYISGGVSLSDSDIDEKAFSAERYYPLPGIEGKLADQLKAQISDCLSKTAIARTYQLSKFHDYCRATGGQPTQIKFQDGEVKEAQLYSADRKFQINFKLDNGKWKTSRCMDSSGKDTNFINLFKQPEQ